MSAVLARVENSQDHDPRAVITILDGRLMSVWREVPRSALQALAQGLDDNRVAMPATPAILERYVGRESAGAVASELGLLVTAGFTPAQISILLRTMAASGPDGVSIELVWSGPEGLQASSRDTGIVVPELFASAKRSVLVCGFAIANGDRVFAALARNMDEHADLDVRIFTNIQRPWKDARTDAEIIRAFSDDFRSRQWPGRRMPRVLYDRRALASVAGPRSCLHAKCVIVDDERALVTSANFTEAAMDRNVEAGVLIEDAAFARRLRAQFDALERADCVRPVPV